jgi:RNA polymerase sigma-70 factor (family 1)
MGIYQLKNEHAFNEVYNLYSAKIYANILKMVKDPDLAQELLQDVFVKLWEKRKLIDPEKPIEPYLYQIAKNHVCDHFRKGSADKKVIAYLTAVTSESYSHIEEDLMYKESVQQYLTALDQLPPKRRRVFTLCKIEGKSYFEVSNLMGISPSTVSDHLLKANAKIRDYMASSEIIGITIMLFTM